MGRGWGGIRRQRHAGIGLGALGRIKTSLEGSGDTGGTGIYRDKAGGAPAQGWGALGWGWDGAGEQREDAGGGHHGVVASSTHRLPAAWQSPYLNVFKHFRVEEWKRSHKEGDVTTVMVTEVPGLAPARGGRQDPISLCSCRTRR